MKNYIHKNCVYTSIISEYLSKDQTFCVRAKFISKYKNSAIVNEIEKNIGSQIYNVGYTVSLEARNVEFRIYIFDSILIFSILIYNIKNSEFKKREPKYRPFFHPGVIMPSLCRFITNIVGIKEYDLVLDPFSGTSGLLLEAFLLGANVIGIDASETIVHGGKVNLDYYANSKNNKNNYNNKYDLIVGDASKIPLESNSINYVITDLPYGHSSSIFGTSIMSLYENALYEIHRVLCQNGKGVIISSKKINDIIINKNFTILKIYEYRVHKSLTRFIHVIIKE